MKVIQVELARNTEDDRIYTVCWLPLDPKPEVGMRVRLAGEDKTWIITRTFTTLDYDDLHRDWKVGGLI